MCMFVYVYKWYTEYYVCYWSEIIYILKWTPYPTYDLKLGWFTHILNHFGLVKTCINVTWLDVEDIWLDQYKTFRANYLRVMFWHFTLWLTTREENYVPLCVHLIIHKSYLYKSHSRIKYKKYCALYMCGVRGDNKDTLH